MTADPKSSRRRDSNRPTSQPGPGGSIGAERPSHPRRAATVLMIAVVVVLLVIAAVPLYL